MHIVDRARFWLAKKFSRKTVLFSSLKRKRRELFFMMSVSRYVPFFYYFEDVDVSRFDLVVPLTLESQRYVATHRELFEGTKVLCPSIECIELCNDKKRLNAYLFQNGFQEFIPIVGENLDYPYVVKKKKGVLGGGVFIVRNVEDEAEIGKKMNEINSEDYFKQQYIPGKEEYVAYVIMTGGDVVFFRVLKFTFREEYYVKGKYFNPISIKEVDHDRYRFILKKILSYVCYRGFCHINYKVVDDKPKLFEINPFPGLYLARFMDEALTVYDSFAACDY